MAEHGPEEVVRQYLEAEVRLEPTAGFMTGPMRTFALVAHDALVAVEASSEHAVANIRSIRLRKEANRHATIDLDAFVVHDVKSKHGGATGDYRFLGPVELREEADGWKIASVVVDGIAFPEGFYEPIVEMVLGECELTLFARPTKKGTVLFARVTNTRNAAVVVSELEITMPYLRLLQLRWGSIQVPAAVGPGASWAGMSAWMPTSLRRSIGARIVVDGNEASFELKPSAARVSSVRVRLRRTDGTAVLIVALLLFGLVNAIATDWRGPGFLGIALAIGGTVAASRGAIFEIAGFRSSGSIALIAAGAAATIAGSAIMLRHGLGWIGILAIVGSIAFAMQSGFVRARYMRRTRSRQVETG